MPHGGGRRSRHGRDGVDAIIAVRPARARRQIDDGGDLALACATSAFPVGMLDDRHYGPRCRNCRDPRAAADHRRHAAQAIGRLRLKVMSIGFLVEEGDADDLARPMVMRRYTQMLREVEWGKHST